MNPENVPPWGCPWHGLVRAGQLLLPNGQEIAWPGVGFTHLNLIGTSRLIRRPGMPEIVRTPEEQEADELAGRQWWNVALLAGNSQLHGYALGTGAWLYIDPAGDRWICSTDLFISSVGTINLQLRRFGDFGVAPETHTYSVTLPDLGQGAPEIGTGPGTGALSFTVGLGDTTPTGARALLVLLALWNAGTRNDATGVGWVEITLSGLGAECVATATVLKTRAQALGVLESEQESVTGQVFSHGPIVDPVYGTEENPGRTRELFVSVGYDTYRTREVQRIEGRVLGMFYSPAGELRTVTADFESVFSGAIDPRVDFQESTFTASFDRAESLNCGVTLRLDGDVVDAAVYTVECDVSFQLLPGTASADAYARVNEGFRVESHVDYNSSDGGAAVRDASADRPWDTVFIFISDLSIIYTAEPTTAALAGRDGLSMINRIEDGGQDVPTAVANIRAACHSHQLFSLAVQPAPPGFSSGGDRAYRTACATPSGVLTLSAVIIEDAQPGDFLYGSYSPATGEAARDTVPIYYI